jgi:predicted MPP superfamily phosphohydrolase
MPSTPMFLKRRQLAPPRLTTGKERRWLDPNRGLLKMFERDIDFIVSRYIYPHLLGIWNPYSSILTQRFSLAEISVAPPLWPQDLPPLRILLLSDIHTGIFLKAAVLSDIVASLMELEPDLVAIAGDMVTGQSSDVNAFLGALAPLSRAPLGAWYCFGNHDYFDGNAGAIRKKLESVGITTLVNESVEINHGGGQFVLGGIDDFILGKPDWERLLSNHGAPHLLLAHHPDFFYQAVARNIALTLSGHTHGGQIRPPWTPPLVRHSEFCLDEGAYRHKGSLLIVSRGLGSVGLPVRYGADPEAVWIEVQSSGST